MTTDILLLADTHYSTGSHVDEVERFLNWVRRAHKISSTLGINSGISNWLLRYWDHHRQTHVQQTIQNAQLHGQYRIVISLGDNTHGVGDTGLMSNEALAEAAWIRNLIKPLASHDTVWVSGNHDIGWLHSSGAQGTIGPSRESFAKFETIYGPQFGCRELNADFQLIWLSSEPFLLWQRRSPHLSSEQDALLNSQRQQELDFLAETLRSSEQKFFIAVHDAAALLSPELQAAIKPHHHRLVSTFCGHVHARWLAQTFNFFKPKLRPFKIQTIPSVWGIVFAPLFVAPGAGWAKLVLEDGMSEPKATLHIYRTARQKFWQVTLC